MSEKIAIIIDGAFLRSKLREINNSSPTVDDIVKHYEALLGHPELSDFKLFRVYYYDAYPLTCKVNNPLNGTTTDLSMTPQARNNLSLIESLELKSHFAVRKGNLVCHGWKIGDSALDALLKKKKKSIEPNDVVPDIKQKGVDIKIGLDIAWLASKRIVDIILLISGDADLVPAMKFARKEGLKVFLNTLGHPVNRELKVHTDLIINL